MTAAIGDQENMTVRDAAIELDMVPSSVRRAIDHGHLSAERRPAPINQHGYYLVIPRAEVARFKTRPKQNSGGRPRKVKAVA